ncbi:MAG: Gfo/Idh/MocA family oxidoreductase [Clostridia bacterium]|nr:Gfo/Idh/MocA family oxidoreductase [Clostridia bacterium]
METMKLFIVGAGGYGHVYMNRMAENTDADLVLEGICEVAPGIENVYPIIKEKNIPVYRNIEDFYKEHTADLAIISTPIHLHHPQVLQCLAHGSNVLVEKPVCTSLEEAEELIAAEKASGCFVSVGYQTNYGDAVLAIKRDILAGKFGKPVYMRGYHGYRRGDKYYGRNNWAGKRTVNGHAVNDSPLNNSNAHQFQNMLFLLGDTIDTAADVVKVDAELYRVNPIVENFDTVGVRVETTAGVPVFYCTTHNCKDAIMGPYSEFKFEKATIYLHETEGEHPEDYIVVWNDGTKENYGRLDVDHKKKFHDTVDCVKNGGHPVCTVQAAMTHLRVIETLAKLPVKDVDRACVTKYDLDGDTMYYLNDVETLFRNCYKEGKLPTEAGICW